MYNRILVPLDGSKLGECTLEHVKEVASGCHVSEVILFTVFEEIRNYPFWLASESAVKQMEAEYEDKRKQVREKAEEYLRQVANKLELPNVTVHMIVEEETELKKIPDIILDYAHNNNIDLVIMSTHGRSGVTRWAFGNVADKIAQQSQVPVLVVAPQGCRV